jgi:hypothetical protein
MVPRKKIVPPVTPRIVQTNPRQRFLRFAMLLGAFLLVAWLSYDYGRTPAQTNGDTVTAQSTESKQRITELEQERDTLKQQVEELEQSLRQANRALGAAQTRSQVPAPAPKQIVKQAPPAPRKAPAAAPVASAPEPVDYTLLLNDIRIEQTESENAFRITFSVENAANNTDRVIGTIWIAVNGHSGKQPRRLSFNTLSSDNRTYVKMGFSQQQDITEVIVLPDNFRPKNILIEAKPYGEKYTGTSEKVIWSTDE